MIKKLLKWVFLIFFALIILLVLINAFDEDLKPEAKQALNWQSPEGVLNSNGYIVLLGIDAPSNADAEQAGIKRYQDELARYQMAQTSHAEVFADVAGPMQVSADKKWELYRCDYQQQASCVDFYRNLKAQDLTAFYASQQWLADRFDTIKKSHQYKEATPPSLTSYVPSYSNLTAASTLVRVKAVRLIADGKVNEGMELFLENAKFSRFLMKNSNSLLSRMVAVSMVQKDMRILSELITQYPAIAIDFSPQLSTVVSTVALPEYRFIKPFQAERNGILHTMYQLKFEITKPANSFSEWMTNLFFHPNATVNLFYDWWQITLDSMNADQQDLIKAQQKIQKQQQDLLGWGIAPYYFRNPVAKILVTIAQPDYLRYVEKQYDLEGYIQLINLQIGMSKLNMTDKDADSQIETLFKNHLNPYTGKPMRYDKDKHQILFNGHQDAKFNFGGSSLYRINLRH